MESFPIMVRLSASCELPYSMCTLFNCLSLLLLFFQDGGTTLMAASESDHTDVVQLLHSSGEPKDEVRHNMN